MTVAATQQLSNQQIHHRQQQQVFNASNNTYTITKQTHIQIHTYTLTENHKENNITKTKNDQYQL